MTSNTPDCTRFTGYKPCAPGRTCESETCADRRPFDTLILIINLDAMGDVLMTTAQLPALKRAYPESTIWWLTLKNAAPLLAENPYLDQVLVYGDESLSILGQMRFDLVVNVDKTRRSAAAAVMVPARERRGFGLNDHGQIVPLNDSAEYNYRLGLDDDLKFRTNTRTRQDYVAETFGIPYSRDEYVFRFSPEEEAFIDEYRRECGIGDTDWIVGFNTGCSLLFPNKKLTIDQHCMLIERFLDDGRCTIVLVGGPEDTERNAAIEARFPGRLISTPTTGGVRRGACYEAIPDVVITGDSFGMHLAIALKKYVIAWFGLSCHQEIDLYERGVKLPSENLDCSPCWKRACPRNLECIERVDLDRIYRATIRFFEERR